MAKVCQDSGEQMADTVLAFEWLSEIELVTFDRAVSGKPNVVKFEVHNGNSQNKPFKERTVASSTLGKCLALRNCSPEVGWPNISADRAR